jgi:hypothetical protein
MVRVLAIPDRKARKPMAGSSSMFTGKSRKPVRVVVIAGAAVVLAAIALVAPGRAARADGPLGWAMTVAGGNSVIAVQTNSDGLRFYWNEHGTNNWYGQQVAADGTTFSAPAIAVVGNDVVIAAQGPFDSLDVYWQAIDATGWNSKQVAGSLTTFSQPAIQADGTSAIIAAEGASNSLDFYWTPSLTTNWTPETVAGAGTTYSAPAEIVNDNSVNIAAEGASNSLDFYWAVNGTTTWGPEVVAGAGTTTVAPAMTASNGTVVIIGVDSGLFGTVESYSALDGTANWIPEEVGGGSSVPSIVAYPYVPGSPGGLHVAVNGFDGYMGDATQVDGSFDWQYAGTGPCPPRGLNYSPLCSVGNPSAVMNGGLLNIASEDGNGNLIFFWQDSSGSFHEETVDTAANLN